MYLGVWEAANAGTDLVYQIEEVCFFLGLRWEGVFGLDWLVECRIAVSCVCTYVLLIFFRSEYNIFVLLSVVASHQKYTTKILTK